MLQFVAFFQHMGGFDLSVLVLFIVLQFSNFLMGDLIGPIWYQL